MNWTSEPSGTLANLDGAAFGGTFAAVGFNTGTLVSEILTSADGKRWSEVVTPLLARVFLNGVAYGGGKLVAVGTNGTILTSANGIAWTRSASGTVAVLRAVAYGGGRFVAVGEGGAIFTSPDGMSWTYEDSGTFGSLHGIAYGDGRFVAVGPTAVVTSPDGLHWKVMTKTEMSGLYAVAYGEGEFTAVGERGAAYTSGDGSAWFPGPSVVAKPGAPPLLTGVAYGSGQFVAVAGDGGIWSIPAPMAGAPQLAPSDATTPPAASATAAAAPAPPGGSHQLMPAVVSITPPAGLSTGGTTITISGSGLAGATQVSFQPSNSGIATNGLDCNAATLRAPKILSTSDSKVVAVTPPVGTADAELCAEDVVVTTPAGSSSLVWQDRFLYLGQASGSPIVGTVSPQKGPASGGTQITITGEGFAAATEVSFGGVPAAFSIKSDSTIIAVAPPAPPAAGTVVISVTASKLTSQPGGGAQFAYDTSGQVYLPGLGWTTPQKRFTDLGHYPWASAAIDALAAQGIVEGAAPGRFDPGAPVTRAEFAVTAQRLFRLLEPRPPVPFTDVRPGDWDYGAVESVAPYIGIRPHVFAPREPALRQDVAAAIVRILVARGAAELLDAADAQAVLGPLADDVIIAPGLRVYAATAIRERIMLGFPDGTFKPRSPLTRAEAAVLLYHVERHFLQMTPLTPLASK